MADRFDSNNRLLREIAEATEAAAASGGGINAAVQAALDAKQNSLGFTPENVANKSTDTNLGNSDTAYPSQKAVKTYADAVQSIAQAYTDELTINHTSGNASGATVIDFTASPNRTLTLTGNVSLTTTNRAAARSVVMVLVASGADRTVTFPADWKFFGDAPANPATILNGDEAILSITSFGTNETNVKAVFSPEA